MTVSLLMEPHDRLTDMLVDEMSVEDNLEWRWSGFVPPAEIGSGSVRTVNEVLNGIETDHAWALAPDYADPAEQARFWYVSANKLEPRLGERWEEPGADLELPLAVGRDIAACHADLSEADPDETLPNFLLRHPEHRHTVRRLADPAIGLFGQIRDNLVGKHLLPLDLLRCKLAFFGATRFDPKSDRWLRINMFCHAPYPDEIDTADPDDWIYPGVAA